MKKIILSAAIAAICATPFAASAADNNLYGALRASVGSVDDPNAGTPAGSAPVDGTQLLDNTSRLGIKGEFGDGLKAFYHLQVGAPAGGNMSDSGFTRRFFFAGLKGGFGKVAAGHMSTGYKMAGFKMDPFYDRTRVNVNGNIAAGGASHGLSGLTNDFADGALQYTTPSFAGFKVNLEAYIDNTNDDEHGTAAGVVWSNKSINAGVQYIQSGKATTVPKQVNDGSAIRVYGGFKAKSFKVGLSYEMLDNDFTNSGIADANYMLLTGTFNVNKEARIAASYGMVDDDSANNVTTKDSSSITIGGFYNVMKKTELNMIFSQASLDATGSAGDPSSITIGLTQKFGFGG